MGIARKKKQQSERLFRSDQGEDFTVSEALDLLDIDCKQAKARRDYAEAELFETESALISRAMQLSLDSDKFFEYHFDGWVDEDTVTDCLTRLKYWDRMDPECPMNIELTSGGGSVWEGTRLFDYLAGWSIWGGGTHEVTIRVRGVAASMGAVLLQAADHRLMGRGSIMMIHEAATGTWGKSSELKDTLRSLQIEDEWCTGVFVERSGMEPDAFKALYERRDLWLSPADALGFGFIDGIG